MSAQTIERGAILTISTAHLHPLTRAVIQEQRGNIDHGPSIAVREEGFLVNSHLHSENVLAAEFAADSWSNGRERAPLIDRMPDLVLVRALARGLRAEWVNIDVDGVCYSDVLPEYDDDGQVTPPTGDGWKDALNTIEQGRSGGIYVVPSRETLEIIEAGQTPLLYDNNDPQP